MAFVYWTNLKGHNSDHPSKKVLLPCQEKKQSSSFGWIIEQIAQGMGVSALNVSSTATYSRVPPWTLEEVPVDCSLLDRRENGGGWMKARLKCTVGCSILIASRCIQMHLK